MELSISENMKKRLEKINLVLSRLDRHCLKLLILFEINYERTPEKESFGFNEFYRKFGKENKFNLNVLSVHLNHLVEKKLLEVKEETKSKLKIKPKKYRLSRFWIDLRQDIAYFSIPDYQTFLKEFKALNVEEWSILVTTACIIYCIDIFRKSVILPELVAGTQRDIIYNYIEHLSKAFRTSVLEKNESQKALANLEELRTYLLQKVKEKHGLLIKKLPKE